MELTEQTSGIVEEHAKAIERVARRRNTFIFIRPTEYDSTRLIKAGYATKSTDVHHKSSNWGPMAGFVPCDPAFSKKLEGQPDPAKSQAPPRYGQAVGVHLRLTAAVVTGHSKIKYIDSIGVLASAPGNRWMVRLHRPSDPDTKAVSDVKTEHRFCIDSSGNGRGNMTTKFCLISDGNGEWLVYWVGTPPAAAQTSDTPVTVPLHPLWVFAYATQKDPFNPRAVTGDYDLWMVVPHFRAFEEHRNTLSHSTPHGKYTASHFTHKLIAELNTECGRADNPVFNHGAEAQNYEFTQALDERLAMFVPGQGTARVVKMNNVPTILGDIQQFGYVVVWNKRYADADPHLGGKPLADRPGIRPLHKIRAEVDALLKRVAALELVANRVPDAAPEARFVQSLDHRRARLLQGFVPGEITLIHRFSRELDKSLTSLIDGPKKLRDTDFPESVRLYRKLLRLLQLQIQRKMVESTAKDGTSMPKFEDTLQDMIALLTEYWGPRGANTDIHKEAKL
jgi:hypothetical protein